MKVNFCEKIWRSASEHGHSVCLELQTVSTVKSRVSNITRKYLENVSYEAVNLPNYLDQAVVQRQTSWKLPRVQTSLQVDRELCEKAEQNNKTSHPRRRQEKSNNQPSFGNLTYSVQISYKTKPSRSVSTPSSLLPGKLPVAFPRETSFLQSSYLYLGFPQRNCLE